MKPATTILLLLGALMPLPAAAQDRPPPAGQLGETAEATGTGAELDFVKAIFAEIQPRSIAINREICGYIGYNRLGELVHTRHREGQEASCDLPNWPRKMVVIASYHTHSTYSPDYDSEVPSSIDMRSDEASGIDGYVATPGGRLWFIDSDTMTTGQICGIGCLYQDPGFRAAARGSIREVYSFAQILKRERD